jgi:hypothetical protein
MRQAKGLIKKEVGDLLPRDHTLLIYKNLQEQFDAAGTYIRNGLARGERCVYVYNDNKQEDVLYELKKRGVDVESAVQFGSLVLLPAEQVYLKPGIFKPELMQEIFNNILQKESGKYTYDRLTSEMTWALDESDGVGELSNFESKANFGLQSLGVCQYNMVRFSPEIITKMILSHPQVIYKNVLHDNFYFVPPEEFLTGHDQSITANRMLEALKKVTEEKLALIEESIQKDELISNSSFKIRGPITTIKILHYLLEKRIKIVDDKHAWNLLYKINKQMDKLKRLVLKLPMVEKPF